MRKGSPGFTFVEMMIVLLLFGIVLTIAVPSMNSTMNEIKLDAAAREVVTAIQYAQSLAIKEGVVHGVIFYPSFDTFKCNKKTAGNIIRNPLDKNLYVIDFTKEGPLQGVDLTSASFGGMPGVSFDSLGEPSSNGAVYLSYADLNKKIAVSGLLGKVTVSE